MERSCLSCGAAIPPQLGRARPRKRCAKCSPPRNRKNPRVIELPSTTAQPLVESYHRQLVESNRLNTPEGAQVIALAELFVAGNHTAAGAASLSKEIRAAFDVAMKGADRQADSGDELQAKRRARILGA